MNDDCEPLHPKISFVSIGMAYVKSGDQANEFMDFLQLQG